MRARPIDIHVTSYALLVYSARGLLQEGMEVLHWLTRQRNPYGGFASTQVGFFYLNISDDNVFYTLAVETIRGMFPGVTPTIGEIHR